MLLLVVIFVSIGLMLLVVVLLLIMALFTVELNLHKCVILIGFGGPLGSTPGLIEGIGFGNVCKGLF